MGQSLNKIYIHIVFSTKHRQALIKDVIKEDLFSYIGGICRNLGCHPVQIGGYRDHVHILCLLSKKTTVVELLEKVKYHSSKWIKTKGKDFENFYWQNGYGVFSVNPTEMDLVAHYILNQEEHHKKKTFQQEFLGFLNKYKVEYDERYVWD